MELNSQKIFEKYGNEIIKTAQEIIQINSQSMHEEDLATYVMHKMKELNYDEVERDKYGNIFGTMNGSGDGKSLMLNTHLDVVEEGDLTAWEHPPYSGEIADGKIWGRGASDTKGTMAIQIHIPYIMKKENIPFKGKIVTACVVSEEIAGFGAMMHTQDKTHLTDYAIIGEASENNIAIGCRGRFCAVVTIKGKSSHASIPENGYNPFDFLEKLLPKLKEMELGKDDVFGTSTMSPTKIESSEKGSNIIPNWIKLFIDYRACSVDKTEDVVKRMQDLLDSIKLEGITASVEAYTFELTTYTGFKGIGFQGEHPFLIDENSDFVQTCKKALEKHLGKTPKLYPWAFATDTGHYARQGVKCIGYSPAEIKLCHTSRDNIDIAMMKEATTGYLAIASELLK